MTNADGVNLTYAGVNWPGHGETMVPEGLDKMSVADMVTKVKSTGMNAYVISPARCALPQTKSFL